MRNEANLRRLFAGDAVLTAVETDGEEAARRLADRYGPPPPGFTPPPEIASPDAAPTAGVIAPTFSYRQVIADLSGDLRRVHEALRAAEDQHQSNLMRLVDLSRRRDEIKPRLQDRFFKVRHVLEIVYSHLQRDGRWQPGFVLANISGQTPQAPRRLLEQTVQTETFLRHPSVEPPSLELGGVTIEFAGLADDLAPLNDGLRGILNARDRAAKEAQGTLALRRQAEEEFDRIFLWTSRAHWSFFHLAGLHELAERIRPSSRRPGRLASDDEPADGDPADGEPAEQTPPAAPVPAPAPASSASAADS